MAPTFRKQPAWNFTEVRTTLRLRFFHCYILPTHGYRSFWMITCLAKNTFPVPKKPLSFWNLPHSNRVTPPPLLSGSDGKRLHSCSESHVSSNDKAASLGNPPLPPACASLPPAAAATRPLSLQMSHLNYPTCPIVSANQFTPERQRSKSWAHARSILRIVHITEVHVADLLVQKVVSQSSYRRVMRKQILYRRTSFMYVAELCRWVNIAEFIWQRKYCEENIAEVIPQSVDIAGDLIAELISPSCCRSFFMMEFCFALPQCSALLIKDVVPT